MDIKQLWVNLQDLWGALDQHPILHSSLALMVLLVIALVLGRVARYLILHAAKLLGRQPALNWVNDLRQNKVFHRLAQMTPSLIIQFGLHLVPELSKTSMIFLGNVALAFTILFMVLSLSALLSAMLDVYARTEHARTRSIKGYVQLTKMVLYVFGAIIIVATLIDRSPLLLLSGLGAMSAVILLVYKDTLLSFVASVQLTSNDMLRVGDWIEMPQVGADGDVVDITLHTVKVQNFDKTIVSIPTWRLMSESFKNWRGMQQSGGRRIKRSLFIDASGVRFLHDEEEQRLTQVRLLTDYIGRKQAELKAWNEAQGNVAAMSANRRRMTNLGTFRAYALAYLKSHAEIQPNMTCMVRQLQTTAQGIPLEIYCFTRTTAWADYERIQGDIFDYLLAVMPEFGLNLYQQPSGTDLRSGLLPAVLGASQLPEPQKQVV
ncbi:mechanosensitive ion channel family protein [Pseudomonas brassicacearum]|jgi:Small-conductance mechanosensitive channel|uniref:mechanosensitive ion channel family protein n=1 Tax=Pseudomonas brassicacearum TaxID=930166 RepID=UPI00025FE47D|nr:mechanosensitive ion channel family protein [Pseudomonas brassicacearum]EIK70171.1 transporter, MscS family [Pseudomonas fluorescens Q8r1-96]KAB0520440.1 mechanosensitive ion channel family protein [Pseudomonas brassicacearum subsp. brassicacearum]NJP63459.1 mechanosensitive ion channel family protein [Pseudomonas brassicacearum]QEO77441.1 mechanosensitive ion channel family protein [Pseudomonas brassicacearum]SDQ00833.1 miniconductance mechanosensitive channel [Pseudomonas brassicacearum]